MNNFTIKCNKCGSNKVEIKSYTEYNGYDEACGDTFELSCNECGNTEELEGE